MNLIKTKAKNRLSTETVILKVKGVNSRGGCVKFSLTKKHQQKMTSKNLYKYYNTDTISDEEQ